MTSLTHVEKQLGDRVVSALGPFVQSIVGLTSSLVVKMLTVLVSTIAYLQVFLLKICEKLLQKQKLLTFFQQEY